MEHRSNRILRCVTCTFMAGVLSVAFIPTAAFASSDGGGEPAEQDSAPIEKAPSSTEAGATAVSASSESTTVDDELIVTYKAGKSIKNIVKKSNIDSEGAEKLMDDASGADGDGKSDISLVKLDDAQDSDEAIAKLQEDPRVESVERNVKFHALSTSVDDTYAGSSYYLQTEKIADAWDYARADGKVTVAVLDSGVTTDSEYLDPDLESTVDYADAWDAVEGSSTRGGKLASDFNDTCGHGTAVAEVIAAEANNGMGIAGVSYDAKVLPVRVLNDDGEGDTAQIVAGYNYVLSVADRLNVKVVNMSLGGETDESEATEMSALQRAIDTAYDKGILTVAAAGNEGSASDGNPVEYPAALDHVVAVGAVDENGDVADFSEHHSYVDIAAAGVGIKVPSFYSESGSGLDPGWDWDWDWGWGWGRRNPWSYLTKSYEYTADNYVDRDGTSLAAPIVSGVAALLYASDESATAAEVESALETTATDRGTAGKDDYYGYGEVDALAALEALPDAAERVAEQRAEEEAAAEAAARAQAAKEDAFKATAPRVTSKTRAKKSLKVGWSKVANASGYRVYYRVKGKKAWKNVSTTKLSKTISKLKRKTNYQIRVCAYLNSGASTIWSKYSSTMTVKTK